MDRTSAARSNPDAVPTGPRRHDPPGQGTGSLGPDARARVVSIALRGRRLNRFGAKAHRRQADLFGAGDALPAFVAGPENRLVSGVLGPLVEALANGALTNGAITNSALADGQTTPTEPLFGGGPITLVGRPGSGKTHLAHGLAELWHASHRAAADAANPPAAASAARRPARDAAYLTGADFSRQLADAIDDGSVNEFRTRLRGRGLLVIDDFDRVSTAAHVQEELLHTLDQLADSGGLLVAGSATLPADAPALSRPLVSRLSEGVVLEIAPLGVEARGELLRQAATTLGCRVDDEALAMLADRLPGEPPRLLGAGVELRRRFGRRVGVEDANRFLRDASPAASPALRDILAVAARYYGVTQKMLTSASRRQTVVLARAVTIYLARRLTPLSYQEIGRTLGGRDHTTILHNFRRIERALPKDRALRSAVDDLRRSLEQRAT